MKTSRDLAILEARTKLLKRHLFEWKTLLKTQTIVRHSAQNLIHGYVILNRNNPQGTVVKDITQQALRLSSINENHFNERQQLRARHQEEETDLEKVFEGHKNGGMPTKIPRTKKGGDIRCHHPFLF